MVRKLLLLPLIICLFSSCKKSNTDCATDVFGSSKWVATPFKYQFDLSSDTVVVEWTGSGTVNGIYKFSDECNKVKLSDLSGANSSEYTIQIIDHDHIKWTDQNNSITNLIRE